MSKVLEPNGSSLRDDDLLHENETLVPQMGGTTGDARDMERMGKMQVMRRNFGFFSIFGFAMILMSTWEAMLATATFGLFNGGTAGVIYMYLVTWFGFLVITLSMAEMASMAPTAGGQYHWVSEFAPPSSQKFLSYLIGWLCTLGWQAGTASATFLSGTQIQGLVVLNHPEYTPQRWHGTLLTIAIVSICAVFNIFLAKRLPLIEGSVLILHICGFFAILVPLWVLAPRADATAVFTQFTDGGGWGSAGVACLVGIISPTVSLLGSDAATHMSEELRNASKSLPKAMVSTLVFNGVLGFVMLVTLVFCIGDLESVLSTPTGYPFIQVFYNATQSTAGATAMTTLMIVLSTFCAITNMATASRQLFSFARDFGVPFHGFFMAVPAGWQIPLNAVITTSIFSSLFSLINIGSNIAFNQITSVGLCALLSSYLVSISCMAVKRIRGQPLLDAPFKLGRLGLPINIIAIAFLLLAYVFIFFPPTPKPVLASMNWSSVIYVGIMAISLVYYAVRARHKYVGPVEYVRKEA